jgi:predicted Mrr-cat superfamily restriction endonuclease
MQIVKIVTHHTNPEKAAELFSKEGVVAVGWSEFGDLKDLTYDEIKQISKKKWSRSESEAASDASQLIAFRDNISKGDIVFAYKLNNTVALVGEIEGKYKYCTKNSVGDLKGEIRYANQRKVKWLDSPRNFDRHFLPKSLSDFVARQGTISIIQYDRAKLEKALNGVPSHETVTKALEIHDEDEIQEYIEKNIEEIEKGLKLVKREQPTSEGPMDFLAKDEKGFNVIIEVKISSDDSTVTQLRRYIRAYKRDTGTAKIRGMIVAENFSKRCIDDVKDLNDYGLNIVLYRCMKKFGFIRV